MLERDGHKCALCGDKNPPFHVHHIQMRSECDELKLDIDNCITLCDFCHHDIKDRESAYEEIFISKIKDLKRNESNQAR